MRHALYLIPDPDSPLWHAASGLIGHDATRERPPAPPALAGFDAKALAAATADPRRYGFHLTLKAPFRLAAGETPDTLAAALTAFCAPREGFDLGPLRLEARLGEDGRGFVCLVPQTPAPALFALEQAAVRAFEPLRAPLNAQEIQRRRPERLTPRQRQLLEHYGYPFVLDEFRPHFSLTGMLDTPLDWCAALDALPAFSRPALAQPCRIGGIALLEQLNPEARFHLHTLAPFGQPVTPSVV